MNELDTFYNLNQDEEVSNSGGDYEKFQDDLGDYIEEGRLLIATWQKRIKNIT